MDIGRAFSYVFQDPQWLKKLLIALVMLIIPIIGWLILFGYILRIVRGVASGSDVPLPEWDDFGRDLALGFKGAVTSFVWSLPATLIGVCSQVASVLSTDNGGRGSGLGAFTLAAICLGCVSFILSFATTYVLPVPLSRLAVTDRLSEAFALSEIFREIGRAATPLLLVLLITVGLSFFALFGVLLCIVGIVATILYAYLVQAHLWGQVRRQLQSGETTGAPVPVVT
ncbi:DUF4013 domain-containing protein [Thermomicrobium sp. 4228-Ro]|uniref:DUF4013 domain-containing protein n=1 Tax=Thermomicrobium sp. 4228-Ro TaxID=2993937 RepID=UPI002248F174|nr:DUF4013 domain-containing protein [Thermomicrobium sp. 4228-Ro]MCX2726220.1 DUF4013 domain-containing protein [Thermomicrobium sp. 4228-Ro]